MPNSGQRPTASEAQIIGKKAEKCFAARCPESWLSESGSGTADFGIDYNVQAFENGQASDSFRVQLKGTESPKLNAAETHFFVDLKASTVRYYQRFTEPILLVLCDLSVTARAIDCPLYYIWIHEELKRINASDLPDEQVSVTLHVPKDQVLDEDTNLSKDIAHSRVLSKIGESLHITLEKQQPSLDASSRVSLLEKLPRAFSERSPALMESMGEEPATPWPVRPTDSMPWHLSEIDRYLIAGALDRATEMLAKAEQKLGNATTIEVGEYWHLKGRLELLNLNQADGCQAFKNAMEAAPNNPKHVAAWAETKMALSFSIDGPNNFEDIYPFLTSSTPEILAVKARLLAAENRDDEADAVLDSFNGLEQLSTKAIFRTMRSRWADAIDICNAGLALTNTKEATRLLFLVLRSKAQFHLAVELDPDPVSGHLRSPLTGRANSDLALLAIAWEGMKTALEGLRSAGWPANTEFVADVFCAAASILQKEEEALSILLAGAEKRHNMPVLQASVESLAAQTQKYELALIANSRQLLTSTTKLHRVFLLHMAKRDNDCISFFDANLDSFDEADPMYAETLTVSIVSADRLVRTDLVKKWMPLFDATPELKIQRFLLDYALALPKKKGSRIEALNALFTSFNEHGKPPSIAIQLFYDFNAHTAEEAEKIVQLGLILTKHRLLPLDAVLQLGQAYTTLERWSELLDLASKERRRFSDNQTLVAIEALALDRLGRTPEARDLLSPLIASSTTDGFILGVYIDITTRCGFIEEAIAAAEILASSEKDSEKKRDHLRLLHNLVRAKNPTDRRTHEIAWRMGALTSPTDEINEGRFLLTMAISPHPEETDPAQIEEYQRRLKDYNERFPQSTILRGVSIPKDATPDEIMAAIMKLMGDTPETLAARQREQQEFKNTGRYVPFSWRPQLFKDARDIPELWAAAKESKGANLHLEFTMVIGDWIALRWIDISDRVPLMDMTALLVAYDLDILDDIFKLFDKVAVPQRIMLHLAQLSDPFVGSLSVDKCRSIQQVLQNNFANVLQPIAFDVDSEDEHIESIRTTRELAALSNQQPYLLYCDDAAIRIYCQGPEQRFQGMCTLDVLSVMEKKGILTTKQVAEKIGKLCQWCVGLSIEQGWQIGSLPEELASASTIADGMESIRSTELCFPIFDRMWDRVDASFIDLISHANSLVVSMIHEYKMNPIAVASLMAIWHQKAKSKSNAPSGALDIPVLLFRNVGVISLDAFPGSRSGGQLWHTFLLLVEHIHGSKLTQAKLLDFVRFMAAAAANHDLHMRQLSRSSLHLFLLSGLKDSGHAKLTFLREYQKWRKWLVNDLGYTRPTFVPTWIKRRQPGYWHEWTRKNIVVPVHWKIPRRALADQFRDSCLTNTSAAKPDYRHPWMCQEVSDVIMRWWRISPKTLQFEQGEA